MTSSDDLMRRVQTFIELYDLHLGEQLGYGMHGTVFVAESQGGTAASAMRFAVKVHRREQEYLRERDVYFRLKELDLKFIRQCRVPQLLHHDDRLLVIAMTLVKRPFVLDFAGAYLDGQPDFSEEVLADWQAQKQEEFGRHWPETQAVLRHLQSLGIYMVDVNPGNISFGED